MNFQIHVLLTELYSLWQAVGVQNKKKNPGGQVLEFGIFIDILAISQNISAISLERSVELKYQFC